MRKVLSIAIGAVVLAVVGVSLLLHFDPLCGEELVMEKPSPDGRYVAALMNRNCGATTPYAAHINLRLANSQFHAKFFDGTITEGEVWVSSKYSGTRFCWSSPNRLEIGYLASDFSPTPRSWHDVMLGSDYQNPKCE
jgi:hypothetical protein